MAFGYFVLQVFKGGAFRRPPPFFMPLGFYLLRYLWKVKAHPIF